MVSLQPYPPLKSGSVERRFERRASSEAASAPVAAAGSSIVNRQSSIDGTGRTRWVYQELRDRKVALFIDRLPEGFWQIRYELRAEVPGQFHALPVVGQAMYVPEIRGNSAEIRIEVKDTP